MEELLSTKVGTAAQEFQTDYYNKPRLIFGLIASNSEEATRYTRRERKGVEEDGGEKENRERERVEKINGESCFMNTTINVWGDERHIAGAGGYSPS